MNDPELDAFKSTIDLRQYAAAQGYELDRRDSWRGSAVMRRHADKIIIKRNGNGHYIYFSVRDERDNGTIIDFVQQRQKLSLGQVRKELRPWTHRVSKALPLFPELVKTSKDRSRVESEYLRMKDTPPLPYLEQVRGIPASVLLSPRFAGRIRTDQRHNAVFPHFDADGLCGYELKNRGFTGFAAGGEKGLWLSRGGSRDERLVLGESGIEALSYAALFPDNNARYASIGGKPNPTQPALINAEILTLSKGAEIVAAMNADDEGEKLVEVVRLAVVGANRPDLRFTPALPSQIGSDWNDMLRERRVSAQSAPVI